MSLGYLARLETRTRGDDLTEGIAARVYNAAWLLARQWQLGELTGNDGGTPAAVRHVGTSGWCTGYTDAAGSRPLAPGEGPLEAFIEAGPAGVDGPHPGAGRHAARHPATRWPHRLRRPHSARGPPGAARGRAGSLDRRRPVSWTRRRATIGRGEGSSGLRFDDVTPS